MSDEKKPPIHIHVIVDGKEIASFLVGNSAIVGEQGPEKSYLPEGATVIDHQEDEE